MHPIDYLHIQMALEGIQRTDLDCMTPISSDADLPYILVARLAAGGTALYLDESLPPDLRLRLPMAELKCANLEAALPCFEKAGIPTQTGHFVTNTFPESFRSAKALSVNRYPQDDPRIVAFGFNGLSDTVFGMEEEGRIISTCVSSRQDSHCAECWVFTHPDYRRKGLAVQVVTAWAAAALDQGVIPFYSHKSSNINSAHLAKHLGLVYLYDEYVIEKPSD